MYIESIELKDYRNYETLSLNFDKGTNIFYGDNAQGKTNILEAVYLCGTTKSHRGSKDREMIRFHADESHIRMFVKKEGISRKIDCNSSALPSQIIFCSLMNLLSPLSIKSPQLNYTALIWFQQGNSNIGT